MVYIFGSFSLLIFLLWFSALDQTGSLSALWHMLWISISYCVTQ